MKIDLAKLISLFSAAGILVLAGILTMKYELFPAKQVSRVLDNATETVKSLSRTPRFVNIKAEGPRFITRDEARVSPGATLVALVDEERRNHVKVFDRTGNLVQEWNTDIFEIWEGSEFAWVPGNQVPKTQPGANVHGIKVTPDGGIIFNFEYISTVRLDACSNVMWKLENNGHHFVSHDLDEDYWISTSLLHRRGTSIPTPNIIAPFGEDFIVEISPDGEEKQVISVVDLLYRNDLWGLLYVGAWHNTNTRVRGDVTHINDVETYPTDLPEGVFNHGDLLVSIRNLNAVIGFDRETLEVKHVAQGIMLRQHDVDFVGPDTYIVFDNRNIREKPLEGKKRSRILEIKAAPNGSYESYVEVFRGEGDAHYFTDVMGAQQPLPNGNVLVNVSYEGRAVEITPEGE
ncbi:MAG: arylsulfotransferase family protein, partial [Pseudomonadota bacterium]